MGVAQKKTLDAVGNDQELRDVPDLPQRGVVNDRAGEGTPPQALVYRRFGPEKTRPPGRGNRPMS